MSDGDVILKEIENGEKRVPKRIIHFASGETMEEYSTEEEEEEEEGQIDFRSVDTAKMSWKSYIQFWIMRIATGAFFTCDFLGGQLATLFGLTVPKYQYAIDEYNRRQEEDSSDEDGQEIPEMVEIQTEKQHLPTQNVEYGAISLKERPAQYEDGYNMDSDTHQLHET